MKITETQFANDTALYSTSQESFETSSKGFVSVADHWRLAVSVSRTKRMIVGWSLNESDTILVQVDNGTLEIADQFTYLGADDWEVISDVAARIAKVAGPLRESIFLHKALSTAIN